MTKLADDQAALANQFAVPRMAASASPAPPFPVCGDFDMRILGDGTWLYRGSPIGRIALVKLFASVLSRDAAGDYWLATPVERGRILVDDAPFTAVGLEAEGAGRAQSLVFRTNLDERVLAGPEHPIRLGPPAPPGGPRPYLLARPGLEALIVRAVYYQLIALAVEEPSHGAGVLGVWSGGVYFPLGSMEAGA